MVPFTRVTDGNDALEWNTTHSLAAVERDVRMRSESIPNSPARESEV